MPTSGIRRSLAQSRGNSQPRRTGTRSMPGSAALMIGRGGPRSEPSLTLELTDDRVLQCMLPALTAALRLSIANRETRACRLTTWSFSSQQDRPRAATPFAVYSQRRRRLLGQFVEICNAQFTQRERVGCLIKVEEVNTADDIRP